VVTNFSRAVLGTLSLTSVLGAAFGCSTPVLKGLGGDGPATTAVTVGSGSGASTSASTSSMTTVSSDPPPSCLDEINCVSNSDCPNGYRCNTSLGPPQCEKLYCGGPSTKCSDVAFCQQGLECTDGACTTPPPAPMKSCSPPPGIGSCNIPQAHGCIEVYSPTSAKTLQAECSQIGGELGVGPCPSGADALCSVITGQDLQSFYSYDSMGFNQQSCAQEQGLWCPL